MKADIRTQGLQSLADDLNSLAKPDGLHKRAVLHATNRVGSMSRTRVSRVVRRDLQVSAKAMNKRIKFYRTTFKKPVARLWAGTRIGIPLYEGGTKNKGVKNHAPTGDTFVQTMRSGHKGLFYRSHRGGSPRTGGRVGGIRENDTPISEVRINGRDIHKAVNESMPSIATNVWRERFPDLYSRDLDRRLRRRNWR